MDEERLQLGVAQSGEMTIPADAVTQTIAILARRGQGKTYFARGLAEEMGRVGAQFVVLDPVDHWWGLRSGLDGESPGLPVYIFGGKHGDLPLHDSSGAVLADAIADTGISAILCTRHLSQSGKRRFVADFCERIYERKGAQDEKTPLHLFIEECQEYVPQRLNKGDERMFGAVRRIVRLGRGDGFGVSLISQRPQSINKDVLTQCEVLVCFQVTHKLDRRALEDWVEAQDTDGHREQFMSELAGLQRGEGWVWSPAWLQVFERVRFRENATYDSSSTPTADAAVAGPRVMAELDLADLRGRMEATIEQVEANDPRALRQRIAALQRERDEARAAKPDTVVERVEVPVVDPETHERISALIDALQGVAEDLGRALVRAERQHPRAPQQPPPSAAPTHASAMSPASGVVNRDAGAEVTLKKGARRMLANLVAFHPRPLTRRQLGTLAMLRPTGGTFSSYLSDLRRNGLIDEEADCLRPTEAGQRFDNRSQAAIQTTDELVDAYKRQLKAGARRMFDELLEAYPSGYSRSDLAERAGIEASGGTFSSYLSDLRRNGLIHEEPDGVVRVDDSLYLVAR